MNTHNCKKQPGSVVWLLWVIVPMEAENKDQKLADFIYVEMYKDIAH